MATTFFLNDAPITATLTGITCTQKALLLTRGSVAASTGLSPTSAALVATITDGSLVGFWPGTLRGMPPATNDPGSTVFVWVTNPLNAVTVAGSITANLRALEDSAQTNYGVGAMVYMVASAGTLTEIGRNKSATELGTSEAARSFTITPTSTALSAGDRLAVFAFYSATGGSATSGHNSNCFWNGPTSGASGDTFVTFTETISEQVASTLPPLPVYVDSAVARSTSY